MSGLATAEGVVSPTQPSSDLALSYLDLRAFAAKVSQIKDQPLSDYGPDTGDAFFTSRVLVPSAIAPDVVTAITMANQRGQVATMPQDEFLIVLSGVLQIEQDSQSWELTDGDAIVVPQGAAFGWKAIGSVSAIAMRNSRSTADGLAITPILKNPPMAPSASPAPEILLGPMPECRNYNDFRVQDGKFVCGTWDSTAYHRKGFLYGHYEIMHLLEGSVIISDEVNGATEFRTGDVFLAEAGSHCAWESRENVTKVFAIFRIG